MLEISLRLDSAPLARLPIPGFEFDRVGDSSRSQCEVAAPKLAAQGIHLGLYEPTSKDVNEENLGARPFRRLSLLVFRLRNERPGRPRSQVNARFAENC